MGAFFGQVRQICRTLKVMPTRANKSFPTQSTSPSGFLLLLAPAYLSKPKMEHFVPLASGAVREATEEVMRLKVPYFDGRKWGYEEIIDEDTGKTVGHIRCNGTGSAGDGGIEISLFDKKYRATVNSRPECYGFVKGVEAVLNRITSIDDGRHKLERQLYEAKKKLSSYPMPGLG